MKKNGLTEFCELLLELADVLEDCSMTVAEHVAGGIAESGIQDDDLADLCPIDIASIVASASDLALLDAAGGSITNAASQVRGAARMLAYFIPSKAERDDIIESTICEGIACDDCEEEGSCEGDFCDGDCENCEYYYADDDEDEFECDGDCENCDLCDECREDDEDDDEDEDDGIIIKLNFKRPE